MVEQRMDGDGEDVPTVSHVWTGDGKELTRLDSWVEGYFR